MPRLIQRQESSLGYLASVQYLQFKIICVEPYVLRLCSPASMGNLQALHLGGRSQLEYKPVGRFHTTPFCPIITVKGFLRSLIRNSSNFHAKNLGIPGYKLRGFPIQLDFIQPHTSCPACIIRLADIEFKDTPCHRLKLICGDIIFVAGTLHQRLPISVIGQQCVPFFLCLSQQLFHGNLAGIQCIEFVCRRVDLISRLLIV